MSSSKSPTKPRPEAFTEVARGPRSLRFASARQEPGAGWSGRASSRAGPSMTMERTNMADISASTVMELRQRTGLGMMECKKALTEAEGNVAKAEELLRIKSGAKASKAA